MKCGSGTSHLWKFWQNKCGKRNFRSLPVKEVRKQNFTYLAVKAERKCGSGTSHFWQSSGTEEAEVWQSRQSRSAFTSLGMKADLKCETTALLQSRQKGSAEAELPIFGNEGRVLVEKPTFRSLAVKIERKCRSETAKLWKSRQR